MIGNQMKPQTWSKGSRVGKCARSWFRHTFVTLARTLEMSKGSNVTGTGCLIKFKIFRARQLADEGKDFGSLSCILAVVSDD